jgi:hypothetical protein
MAPIVLTIQAKLLASQYWFCKAWEGTAPEHELDRMRKYITEGK